MDKDIKETLLVLLAVFGFLIVNLLIAPWVLKFLLNYFDYVAKAPQIIK